MKNKVLKLVLKWSLDKVELLHEFPVGGGRLVYKLQSDIGPIILKGYPIKEDENSILGNVYALDYLGNQKGLAPKLIYLPNGDSLYKDNKYYYCLMEYVEGRETEETVGDEFLLGRVAATLHNFDDYKYNCTFDVNEDIKLCKSFYHGKKWKKEFDEFLDYLPDFYKFRQCFIHTDLSPSNSRINIDGKLILVDLDSAGIGPQYIDIGWPLISQFVHFDKVTKEMYYKFDIAKAFLEGYLSVRSLSEAEYELSWQGAIYSHIYNMQWFGENAADDLWEILLYGSEQKHKLRKMINI